MTKLISVDGSMLNTFRACPRMYYFEYILNWRRAYRNTPADWGTVVHAGLEEFYKHQHELDQSAILERVLTVAKSEYDNLFPKPVEDSGSIAYLLQDDIDPKYSFDRAATVLTSYIKQHYQAEPFDLPPIQTEVGFAHELIPGVVYCGKKDLVVNWPSLGRTIIDHKTTGIFGRTNLDMNKPNSQGMGYIWSEMHITDEQPIHFMLNWLVNRKNDYTFERALPAAYFADEIQDWLTYTIWTLKQLKQCYQAQLWPRAVSTCYRHFGKCQFLPICFTRKASEWQPEEIPDGYMHYFWEPFKGARKND